MKFITKELEVCTIVHFELEDTIKPEILRSIVAPRVNPRKGVVISGRGPI